MSKIPSDSHERFLEYLRSNEHGHEARIDPSHDDGQLYLWSEPAEALREANRAREAVARRVPPLYYIDQIAADRRRERLAALRVKGARVIVERLKL